jgi:hypothetical protein
VGYQLGRLGPLTCRLLVGRTYLSGTAVSLVGGDPGYPCLTGRCGLLPAARRLWQY